MSTIADNLVRIQERIAAAAETSGRRAEAITLVGVTKKQAASILLEAQAAGMTDFGENYIQETIVKRERLMPSQIAASRWHLIGHLQTNKSKAAVALFDLIQSVDTVKVAHVLDKEAAALGKRQDILLQVHLGDEATKTGVPTDRAQETALEIASFSHVRLCGLMGIAPLGTDNRSHFRELRRLFDQVPDANRRVLSMGMSGDFETAIEEGATMVRVGTAIFGARS